jgi:hypothetical protein
MMTLSLRYVLIAATAGLMLLSLLTCASSTPTPGSIAPPEATEAATPAPVQTSTADEPSPETPAPTPREVETRELRLTPFRTALPVRIPTLEPGPVTGEVPPNLLDAILADAESRTDIPQEEFAVVRAEAVVWNDGSLGCPQPGMMYTQALVDGYWVVLEAGSEQYDYRADQGSYFLLCEQSLPLKPGPPDGGTSPTPQQ